MHGSTGKIGKVYFYTVTIDLGFDKYPAYVCFHEGHPELAMLGQVGFFDRFSVGFKEWGNALRLRIGNLKSPTGLSKAITAVAPETAMERKRSDEIRLEQIRKSLRPVSDKLSVSSPRPCTAQTMVFVALNLDFKANDNKEAIQNLFGSTSGFLQNDSNIETVLTAIKKINYEDGGL